MAIIKELNLYEAVVKVQIHAGGRGKAGGVRIAKNRDEILKVATDLMGMKIVNQQTGSLGATAEKVLISSLVSIEKEYYVAAAIDRVMRTPVIIASREGGVEIEELVQKGGKIVKIPIDLTGKIRRYRLLELAKFMGWEGTLREEGMQLIANLAAAFWEWDAELIEINPLVLTKEGHLSAIDAKCSIDDNALYRQPGVAQWYDPTQSTPSEVAAKKEHLAYIGLDGNIGCLVNGAGLAMATMDIIHYYGGSASNFLDVGGGATEDQIAYGFKIILADERVKAIFINIFGGIMDCRTLAQGIVKASSAGHLHVPLVVRMEGTNISAGRES